MTSPAMMALSIKRWQNRPAVSVYFENDHQRFTNKDHSNIRLTYTGTLDEKLVMLDHDLKALEKRIGKTNAR